MDSKSTTVLIVDDEEYNLDILNSYLTEAGYNTVLAANGEEAWEILEAGEHNFDLVLLDRLMPGIDGLEVLSRIKANDQTSHLPVIMQTAATSPKEVSQGIEAGAYHYLTKPFKKDILLSITKAALRDHRDHLALKDEVTKALSTSHLIESATFRFHTIEEGKQLAAFLANACPEPEIVTLGLAKLMANAVEHGNLGITYQEKTKLIAEDRLDSEIKRRMSLPQNAIKQVQVVVELTENELVATITDEGEGFNWECYLDFDPGRAFDSHGRGIAVAAHLCLDSINYIGNGSKVETRANRHHHKTSSTPLEQYANEQEGV